MAISSSDDKLKLASILSDLGAECCEKTTLVDVLTQLGPTLKDKEQQIARACYMMCAAHEETVLSSTSNSSLWNAGTLLLAVRESVQIDNFCFYFT